MKKISVRCWKIEANSLEPGFSEDLFVTYPEGNNGHDLITCTNCGEIYAVTVVTEVYAGPPLAEKVKEINCVGCKVGLDNNYAPYPETFFDNGTLRSYQRDSTIPSDETSILKEFWGLYES